MSAVPDELDADEMEVHELQEGVSPSSPAEVAAAAEQASLDVPPLVVGTVLDPPPTAGVAPRLTKLEKTLANLGITLTLKVNAERRWMALSQKGFTIVAEERGDRYTVSLYVFGMLLRDPLSVFIMEREAPSMRWIENFNVHGASNRKEAELLAKIHVHLRVESLRIVNPAPGFATIRILRAPGGILDPLDRHGMVDFHPNPN